MHATYNPWLVALSIAVAVLAAYAALSLAARVAAANVALARIWLFGGAVSMGTGIWATHFIGMMAFSVGVELRYDLTVTLFSLVVAMATSGCAIWTAGAGDPTPRRLGGGALLMGVGISLMHYAGMSAIQIRPAITYEPMLVAASLAIAVAGSFGALGVVSAMRGGRASLVPGRRLAAAVVMALAIGGMHYTGMASSRFAAGAYCFGGLPLNDNRLAVTVALIAIALSALVLIAAVLDAHLQSNAAAQAKRLREMNADLQREAAKARIALESLEQMHTTLAAQEARSRTSEERLRQISDSLPAMIAYWDCNRICRFANWAHFKRFGLTPR